MNKKNIIAAIAVSTFLSSSSYAISFKNIIDKLDSHESVEYIQKQGLSVKEAARMQGSWGDPKVKLAAKNYPIDTLRDNQTAMTGLEVGLSQKISLTTKYGNIEDAFISLGNALSFKAKNHKELLTKSLWELVIIRRKVLSEVKILKENLAWIFKILKVSKKLYANGRLSQQAVLDIQVRKSEIESLLSNKKYELLQIGDKLSYLIRSKTEKLDHRTIPWKLLTSNKLSSKQIKDYKELALKQKVLAKDYGLTAAKMNYIPDLTVSIGYTSRSSIDGNGDFVAASVTFPLPFSQTKYANHSKAIEEKYSAVKEHKNYLKLRTRNSGVLSKEIDKLQAEISILINKTIRFAQNSRTITSKSYGLGNSTYVELLQSELKLQKILLQKVMLTAKRDIKKITLKYTLGEPLYE